MRIRLEGTEAECAQVAAVLAEHLQVVDTSRPYPNRAPSKLVRVYVEIRNGDGTGG